MRNHEKMFPEGTDNKASAGYLYPIGGFCILDTVNPKPIPTAFNLGRGVPMTTKDVKRKLRAILSADVQGYSRLWGTTRSRPLRP